MLRLHFHPGFSYKAAWMLNEIGVPYERVFVDLAKGENLTPAFRRINPLGKVPVLEEDGTFLPESSAICFYLAERFPAARLAPAPESPERRRYLYLMFLTPAVAEPSVIDRLGQRDPGPGSGWRLLEESFALIEREMGSGPYLFGEWFTAADVMLGSSVIWAQLSGLLDEQSPLLSYTARLMARPALAKLFAEQAGGANQM